MSAEPIEHVARPSLPWRDDTLTECGKPTDGRPVISRSAMIAKVKTQGKARAALSSCMTCWETASRWADWATSPVDVMRRNVPAWHQAEREDRLNAELRAIAALIEAHRDEFDGYLTGLDDATDLGARRLEKRMRRAGR